MAHSKKQRMEVTEWKLKIFYGLFYKAPYNRHYTKGERKRTLDVEISKEVLSYQSEWEKRPKLEVFKRMVRTHARKHGIQRDPCVLD